ncbi:MAG: DUF2165 domain-containing protein [Xanthobacteraceae bacterium]
MGNGPLGSLRTPFRVTTDARHDSEEHRRSDIFAEAGCWDDPNGSACQLSPAMEREDDGPAKPRCEKSLMLAVRITKIALIAGFALHASLIVFGNVTDYGTNFDFVRHVLSMDTVFPNTTIQYRAITDPTLHQIAYLLIIITEAVVAGLCWLGSYRLLRALRSDGRAFNRAKPVAIAGLTLGILLWQVGFITIGGEWFGMWMSHQWNGIPSAFRFVMILYASLILLVMRDDDLAEQRE